MASPLLSKRRAWGISLSLFSMGLLLLFFIGGWWPGISLVIGTPLAFLQLVRGRVSDMFFSLFVFVGLFLIVRDDLSWKILLPILFIIAALYLLCKEWVENVAESEEAREEDLNKELEEDAVD